MSTAANLRAKINGLVAPDLLRVMLLEIANVASPPGQEGALANALAERFSGIGIEVERSAGGLRATLRGRGGGPTLVLAGNLASEVERDASGAPRRSGLFDGEWIHGSGVSDMKCAFVVYFGAMKALLQAGTLRGDVVMTAMPAGASAESAAMDAALVAAPTGLRIQASSSAGPGRALADVVRSAHRAVFFGREPGVLEDAPTTLGATLAYGPGGINRDGQFAARDRELGEMVSVPNLVMCTKVYALAIADICDRVRAQRHATT